MTALCRLLQRVAWWFRTRRCPPDNPCHWDPVYGRVVGVGCPHHD